jgi:NADPH:quinone reductase-like Zn-dependent oxidoreductase
MATTSIDQMDAVVIQDSGPPAQSLAVRSEPVPRPGPGEALVEVHAAAVNPIDAVNALGYLGTPLPAIPGIDYAGIVVSDGDYVGQEVWGSAQLWGSPPDVVTKRAGTHARYVALPEAWLSLKPERLTMTEAGAVGRSYVAAWETMIERGQLGPGETVLITGGAGVVGHAAADIARWLGATPIVAARRKPDGVEHFIDISSTDVREAVMELTAGRGVDMVLDAAGGALFEPALRSLRFGGRMFGLISREPRVEFDLVEFYAREIQLSSLASVFTDATHIARIFDQLRPLFDRALLSPPETKTWPLEQAAAAYQTVLDGSGGIKQVLLPVGDEA